MYCLLTKYFSLSYYYMYFVMRHRAYLALKFNLLLWKFG